MLDHFLRNCGDIAIQRSRGTGKTESAKVLTENLFHDERRMIRFDMSEFMEEHSVAKIDWLAAGICGA
jgi:ATP-dependent Clp protease ATP-binding subunit ClpA